MKREEKTTMLTQMCVNKLSAKNVHYAKEVVLDYGTKKQKRIDILAFEPENQMGASGI